MNYILIKVIPDGCGVHDEEKTIAISIDKQALIDNCKNAYKAPVGKPDTFSWEPYFIIRETTIDVIQSRKLFSIEEIKNYIKSRDSLGDVMYFLSVENIEKANDEGELADEE